MKKENRKNRPATPGTGKKKTGKNQKAEKVPGLVYSRHHPSTSCHCSGGRCSKEFRFR